MLNFGKGEQALDGHKYIAENLKRIQENVENAVVKAGRKDSPCIIAVTKTVPPEKVNYAIDLGISVLGENKVQEYLSKRELYNPSAKIHFIGNLQTNKIKQIAPYINFVESANSVNLLQKLSNCYKNFGKFADILIELNVGREIGKTGADTDTLPELLDAAKSLDNICLKGLMTLPPPSDDPSPYFYGLAELAAKYSGYFPDKPILSMGTSLDYPTAVEYGATHIRIGTALFGKRDYTT
ncbi:MAG: YggS family pyridoxal phosphate-dependent enzyme [Oscillospiraceae bacterium]|nr:YggS family pyridoxal phosphate-dependent enzyme [Oscillospiraceae bacterium]